MCRDLVLQIKAWHEGGKLRTSDKFIIFANTHIIIINHIVEKVKLIADRMIIHK